MKSSYSMADGMAFTGPRKAAPISQTSHRVFPKSSFGLHTSLKRRLSLVAFFDVIIGASAFGVSQIIQVLEICSSKRPSWSEIRLFVERFGC